MEQKKTLIPSKPINNCDAGSRRHPRLCIKWPILLNANTHGQYNTRISQRSHTETQHWFINKSKRTVKMSAFYCHHICTLRCLNSAGWIKGHTALLQPLILAGHMHVSLNIYVQKYMSDKRLWWYYQDRHTDLHHAADCIVTFQNISTQYGTTKSRLLRLYCLKPCG